MNGAFLVGRLAGYSYRQLIRRLGPPKWRKMCGPTGIIKSRAQWVIGKGPRRAIIYDRVYSGPCRVSDNRIWHIGGFSEAALDTVRIRLGIGLNLPVVLGEPPAPPAPSVIPPESQSKMDAIYQVLMSFEEKPK
jgi:hypothetical protein